MLREFSHVMLYVNDVSRATKWYCDILGFVVNFSHAPHYASLRHDAMKLRLDLHPDRSAKNAGHGAEIYFLADDIDGTVAELRAKGLAVTDPRCEGATAWFSTFKDSEGNTLGLWEERSAK